MSWARQLKWQRIANALGASGTCLPWKGGRTVPARAASSTSSTKPGAKEQPLSPLKDYEVYGQPTSATHPHLLRKGELVPYVTVNEFRQRRLCLMQGIQNYSEGVGKSGQQSKTSHVIIIPSSSKKYMSDKIPYVFRQHSDFFYLTGCLEPDTVLVLHVDGGGGGEMRSILFMRPKDKHAELWDGPRTGVDKALELFGVDEAYGMQQFDEQLAKLVARQRPVVWYNGETAEMAHISRAVQKEVSANTLAQRSPTQFVHGMRLFKSVAEQDLMRHTCRIASQAINEVMAEAQPGHTEHHIFAMLDYKCRMKNASYLAYPPVVASGNNATTIHYIDNTQMPRSGELVLVDSGCEYGGYTSDITRTWPIAARFSEPQRVLYDVVLTLQKDLIATLFREGGETLDKLFDSMCLKLGKYLQEVGLVGKDIDSDHDFVQAGYRFCPHHVSHYLGMDVHDTPSIPRNLKLTPGMVFTVEPGIYIAKDCESVPKEFRGIGIRVEDDLLVTAEGQVEILTEFCIKEIDLIENLGKMKS